MKSIFGMKKGMVIGLSLITLAFYLECSGVGINASAVAATEKKTDSKHMREISGEVTDIDREEKTITVGGIIILVDEEMLANIKEGDRVTVDYVTRGTNRAVLIVPQQK